MKHFVWFPRFQNKNLMRSHLGIRNKGFPEQKTKNWIFFFTWTFFCLQLSSSFWYYRYILFKILQFLFGKKVLCVSTKLCASWAVYHNSNSENLRLKIMSWYEEAHLRRKIFRLRRMLCFRRCVSPQILRLTICASAPTKKCAKKKTEILSILVLVILTLH